MVTIDGTDIVSGSTIDGDEIIEITMDGDVVWSASFSEVVDQWNDQDMSSWGGDVGETTFSTTTAPGTDSDYSLHGDAGSTNTTVYSDPGDGLEAYPEAGKKITYWCRSTDTSTVRFGFSHGKESEDDNIGYVLSFRFWTNEVNLSKRDSDGIRDSTDGIDRDGTWYRSVIKWHTDGEITVDIYEGTSTTPHRSLSINDTEYKSGAFSIYAHNNRSAYWVDQITIEDL